MCAKNSEEKEQIWSDTEGVIRAGKHSIKSIRTSFFQPDSLLRTCIEISRINYFFPYPLDINKSGQNIRRRSIGFPAKDSIQCFDTSEFGNKSEEDLFIKEFPSHVTPLMNEDQLWGCFYIFPELYEDVYSPVVRIRNVKDVPEGEEGVLTRDMVTACLTYLKRSPILTDFVFIKLDLSMKHLVNIEVLQHYKYLVYLDLSSNLLTELNVLSRLPYLQYLSVSFNRLTTVLEYDTPQWFLTEVRYKFNSIQRIRDLSAFWSITILDLSHNNIKGISGLETLRYLRHLDLSFNHIQYYENLNHLRLLWLDLSYNNISSFELGPRTGLWTLLHLEYINLSENNLTSMKIFSNCSRLRELHARNNRLSILLELAVYMQQMRQLIVLDLRANPVCSSPYYKDVVINTFPRLLSLDAVKLDSVDQRSAKMRMNPDVTAFSTHRLLRQFYIEQLSRVHVSPFTPPSDTTEVPIIVLVGDEAVGKGTLARRLASECSSHVSLARQQTTARYHSPGHYIEISRSKFDDMLRAGEFLTYTEMGGESYGLSREEAFIKDGKVRIVSMDLPGALMLKLRGRRPYLVLASCTDKLSLNKRQKTQRTSRNLANQERISLETLLERYTLQVLLSDRFIISRIINEMLLNFPEEKDHSEFVMESGCSLTMDNDIRITGQDCAKEMNPLTLLRGNSTSFKEGYDKANDKRSKTEPSLCLLFKGSQRPDEYIRSVGNRQNSYQEKTQEKRSNDVLQSRPKSDKHSCISDPKRADFSGCASSTWKADVFIRRENSDENLATFIHRMGFYCKTIYESDTTTIRDDYESIHRKYPGMFWDTVTIDDPDKAFNKMRRIIKSIVKSQSLLKPMFDRNLTHYPTKVEYIRMLIAPQQLFY